MNISKIFQINFYTDELFDPTNHGTLTNWFLLSIPVSYFQHCSKAFKRYAFWDSKNAMENIRMFGFTLIKDFANGLFVMKYCTELKPSTPQLY